MKRLCSRAFAHLRARLLRRALCRSGLFDAGWYLQAYPEVAAAGLDPALHYLAHGADEGRDPGPRFSTSGYRLQGWRGQGWLGQGGWGQGGWGNPALHHARHGTLSALPAFAGTDDGTNGGGATLPDGAPVILIAGHQAPAQQFGAERSLLAMLERARAAGVAAELVLPHCQDPAYLDQCRARARRVHLIPFPWARAGVAPHPETVAALERLIRDIGAREVHQNTLVADAPLAAAAAAGVPSVVWLRELPEEDPALCARLGQTPDGLRAGLLARAGRFIANSPETARWIDPGACLPPGRVVVLPNPVDPRLFDLPFAPADPVRVALIGSNTAKKGVSDMAEVARRAAAAGLRARFLLIGPPSGDLAALGPLPANLQQAGYTPDPRAALAGADVVLSLSRFAESYGRSVAEAMAAGRPVIAYDRGAPPALLGRPAPDRTAGQGQGVWQGPGPWQGPGAVVPADDPAAVVAALAALLADPARLQAASAAARARARILQEAAQAVPDAALFAQTLGSA